MRDRAATDERWSCHHRRPFLLENHQNRFGASAPAIGLIAGDLPECSRDAVELQGNALLDKRGPLYLAARAAGFSNVCDHCLDRVLKVQTAKSIDQQHDQQDCPQSDAGSSAASPSSVAVV